MGCLSLVSFAIIINGSASGLFRPSKGLRQFYPLSPVLFLFIAEGLSTSILEAKRTGTLRGFKLVSTFYLTHFLFVDDALLICDGSCYLPNLHFKW